MAIDTTHRAINGGSVHDFENVAEAAALIPFGPIMDEGIRIRPTN